MKNLTRILALVLVFTMMVSSAAFAARYTDVADDSTYAEAVEVLSALNIFYGDTAGTFRPDDVITRAEVVAVVNRLTGLSDAAKAAAGTSMYTDVATTDWFAGDVNLASQQGIVAGDGNGLFRPNDQVKYEEAVKMMVAALGYKPDYVLKQGGWPTGYLVIATENEITKGLAVSAGEPATRGIVAKLAYQTLTAPLMVLANYDDDGKARWEPDESKTLLGNKLGFVKLIGSVSSNDIIDAGTTKTGYIKFDLDKAVKNAEVGDGTIWDTNDYINVNGSDVAATYGYATEIYLDEVDDEPVVLTYVNKVKKNNVAVIENVEDIQLIGAGTTDTVEDTYTPVGGSATNYIKELSVYDDETEKHDTYKLDKDATWIYNGAKGVAYNAAIVGGYVYAPTHGSVELLDNNADGYYDYAFVTSYETRVVDSIYGSNKKIGTLVGTTVDLTKHIEGDDGYTYSITLDGEEIAITDLQKYDVLSIAGSDATISATTKHIDIIVSRNVVEGAIEAIDNSTPVVYTIAGADYEKANVATVSEIGTIASTSVGKFYIDAFGEIALFEGETSLTGTVAFMQAYGAFDYMSEEDYELEVLNADGSVVVLNFADFVTVKVGDTDTDLTAGDTNTKSAKADVYNKIKTLCDAAASNASFANRIITYKTNSAGRINAITFADSGEKEGLFVAASSASGSDHEFDASVSSLAYGVTEDTTIFYLPTEAGKTKDDYAVSTISMLEDEEEYSVSYIDVDEAGNAGILVITSDNKDVRKTATLAVVTKALTVTNEEGDQEVQVHFIQNGEEKVLNVDAEDCSLTSDDFAKGAIFEYSTNAKGKIDEAKFNTTLKPLKISAVKATVTNTTKPNNEDYKYLGGYVVAKSGAAIVVAQPTGGVIWEVEDGKKVVNKAGTKLAIPETANITYIDANKSTIKPVVASIGDIQAVKVTPDTGAFEEDCETYVVIKYIDNAIVDVVVYTFN